MWIQNLKVKDAIKEIISDSKKQNDFCVDPLRFEDLGGTEAGVVLMEEITGDLARGKYKVSSLICIDIPKSNYTLRPGARPQLYDNILYHSIVNYILQKIKKKIPKENYHFREYLDGHGGLNHWKEFEEDSRIYATKYKYIISTDIVGFFEHISHEQLRRSLLLLGPQEKDYVSCVSFLIDRLLTEWYKNADIKGFGLPQGTRASSILGDIYLAHFGMKLRERKIPFVHYVDDIRIFAKNTAECKLYIKEVVILLRDLKLNLNTKKTNIFNTEIELDYLFDPHASLLQEVDILHKHNVYESFILAKEKLDVLYQYATSDLPFSERYMKKYLSSMKFRLEYREVSSIEQGRILEIVLDLLENKADLTPRLCQIFFCLANNKNLQKDIGKILFSFLGDTKKAIYIWQEVWILDLIRQLLRLNLIKFSTKQFLKLKKKYLLTDSHVLLKEQIYLIAGLVGDTNTLEEIANLVFTIKKRSFEEFRFSSLALQKIKSNLPQEPENYFSLYTAKLDSSKGKYGFVDIFKSRSLYPPNEDVVFEDVDYY